MPKRSLPHRASFLLPAIALAFTAGTVFPAVAFVRSQTPSTDRVQVGGPPVTGVLPNPVDTTTPDTLPIVPVPSTDPTVSSPSTAVDPNTTLATTSTAAAASSTTSTTASLATTTSTAATGTTTTLVASIASTTTTTVTTTSRGRAAVVGAATTTATTSSVPSTTIAPAAAKLTTQAELQAAISSALAVSKGGKRGIVVSMEGLGNVYEAGADASLPPASAIKLATAGAALLRLGPDHRFVTRVVTAAPLAPSARLNGDLFVVGSGDPSFGHDDLDAIAASVASAGIRFVSGDLVVDDSKYAAVRRNDGWKPAFVPFEVGVLSTFMVAGNHRADPGTLGDPDLANLAMLRQSLAERGVVIEGTLRRGPAPSNVRNIATHTSPPLMRLLSKMVKDSENTYAEQILREIGSQAGNGSTAGGANVVARLFRNADISPLLQYDGSGLSSLDRASARQLVAWLQFLDRGPSAAGFRSTLAIGCVDGTLRSRFCEAKGRVFAKTGTLDSVRTLAGYATTSSGRNVTFAFLFSGGTNSRAAIDASMRAVTAFAG